MLLVSVGRLVFVVGVCLSRFPTVLCLSDFLQRDLTRGQVDKNRNQILECVAFWLL